MSLDTDSTLGRLQRMGSVTLTFAELLPKLLGARMGFSVDQEAHARQIRTALGNLKGPFLKIAQMLGTIPDMVPEAYAEEFRQLQSNAPAMGWPFVRRRMESELGSDWQNRFKSFDRAATAAASLGQVHRAVSLDGQDLAVKLQYPHMDSVVHSDLQQFKLMLGIYEKLSPALETEPLFNEIKDRLLEELDYCSEARYMAQFSQILAPYKEIHIPTALPDLCTGRLLTTTWLEGRPVLEFTTASQEARNQIASQLFHAWYVPLYGHGILHADPHLGNYSVRADGGLNLFDFGCVRVFDRSFLKGVIDLYRALQNNDRVGITNAYQTWGFKNLTPALEEVLTKWARFLYGPLLEDRVVSLNDLASSRMGQKIASEVHEALKEMGGIRPPPEFVFMDRAAVGIGSVLMRLNARLNWQHLFEQILQQASRAD